MSWLALHHFAEAASGQVPAETLDSSVNAQNLTLNYATSALEYAENSTGRGLNMLAATRSTPAIASANITAALNAALTGRQKVTVFMKVASGFSGADSYTSVYQITSGSTSLFHLRAGAANYRMLGFGGHEVVTQGAALLAICIDTTQAVQADRVRAYRSDTATPATVAIASNNFAQNAAVADLTGAVVSVLNIPAGGRNPSGILKFLGIWDDACTLEQVTSVFAALYDDDDANPLAVPSLSFLTAPTVDQVTATSYRVSFVASQTQPYSVIRGSIGQDIGDMPSDAAFDAALLTGTATAGVLAAEVFNGQTPESTYPIFVRVGSDPYIYGYVEATTTAVSNAILSINGGEEIYLGQTGIIVTMDGGAPVAGPVNLNGIAQTGFVRDSDTQFRFDFTAWPNTMVGNTATLTIDGKTATTPMIGVAPTEGMVVLAGYSENPPQTLDAIADAVNGDQFIWNTQDGKIDILADGTLIFRVGAVSPLQVAIVDSADGARSAFYNQPFTMPNAATPDPADLGGDVTGAEPNTEYTGSDVLDGDSLDAGVNKTISATGNMLVSTTAGSGWTSSIVRQKGETWYWRMVSADVGLQSSGGVSIEGVVTLKTITTRSAADPVITLQPSPSYQIAAVGSSVTLSVAGTNIASYQWQNGGVDIPGATSASLNFTVAAAETYNLRVRLTSPEGASVYSSSVQVIGSLSATKLVISSCYDNLSPATVLANQSIVGRVRTLAGEILIPETTYLTDATGKFTIVGQLGPAGTFVAFEELVGTDPKDYRGFILEVEDL